jgi:hypothetical protein
VDEQKVAAWEHVLPAQQGPLVEPQTAQVPAIELPGTVVKESQTILESVLLPMHLTVGEVLVDPQQV